MKKSFLLLIILSVTSITAQNKVISIEDIVINSYSSLKPVLLKNLEWMPSVPVYSYFDDFEEPAYLVAGSRSGKKEVILKLDDLNTELEDYDLEIEEKFPKYEWVNDEEFQFWLESKYFNYNSDSDDLDLIFEIPSSSSDKHVSPTYNHVAYVDNYNLYVLNDDEEIKQVTTKGSREFTFGQSVSRNEFGISKGVFWAPNGKLLAYYSEDLTEVSDYPILDLTKIPAEYKLIKYPMSGQTSSKVSLWIYDIITNKSFRLETGEPGDNYLTCVTWGPESKFIYVAHLNRDQNFLQLYKYDANTGQRLGKLLEEKHDIFIEPEHELKFIPGNKEQFIWQSERDGFNHLYLYNTNGEMMRQLTKGNWEVTEFHGFDSAGENVLITTTEASPLERHLYRVNIKFMDRTKLTVDAGTHKIKMHPSGLYFIDNFTNTGIPLQQRYVNHKGEIESILFDSPNMLASYKLGKQETLMLQSEDSTDLYCRMIYPPDFNESDIYPAIVYDYGGPHDQQITNEWQDGKYNLWFYRMAQEGYITFILDNRGTAHRGLEFEQSTFRQLGTVELADQMTGVDYLKSLEFIDTTRLGVYGWSYGGFMATTMMLRSNNTFKVGVAGGAVIDWAMYEVMYTERYMDTPQNNPTGYKNANLLNYVDNLNGKLLMVHGTDDATVVWQNTLLFAEKAVKLNKPLDYFPYVGWLHHVRGKDAIHLYEKITNYFLDNL